MPFIMITVLIDMLAIGLIIPVLPALVGGFTGSQADQAFWYGVVTFVFGLANFFASPVLGALSDQYGRRPVLLLGFFGLGLNFFATAMATAMWMLLAARVVGGAMQANAAVANAYVAGSLALLNTLYGTFVLPESLPRAKRQPFQWRRANPVSALKGLTMLRGVGPLVWVVGLAGLAQFTMHMSWVLYTTFKFGWGPKENGWSLFTVGVMAAIVQGGLMKQLLKRFSAQRLAAIGLVSSTFCYLAWGLATQGWMMIVIVVANLFGFTTVAALQSLISNAADERDQGRTMGAVASLNSVTGVLAPVIAATLLTVVSGRPPGDLWLGLPFFFCALLQGLAAVLAIRHFQRHRSAPAAAAAAP